MVLFKIFSTPPQNYLVEEILLGCILINPLIFSQVIQTITIESFFLESHQIIYINLLKIYYSNKLHPIELLYSLSENKSLKKIGGLKKIIELMKQSQVFIYSNNTNVYLDKLIQIINNNYTKRLIIQYGYNIIQLSYINTINGYLLYNKASHYLNITIAKMPKQNTHNLQALMRNTIYDMQFNLENPLKNTIQKNKIVKSGFMDLDKLTDGLPCGNLIVLAARPSMGKTSLAINIAYNIIKRSICGVCIFSLEMSSKQILQKFISISSQIPYKYLNNAHIYNNQWINIKEACKKLLNSNIYIYDQTNVSIDYIEYISKIWIRENNNMGLIIIDYLQLIQTDNLINLNRVQQLSYITRKLKMLAQYLNIPILTLSQLNRSIELRVNKEPILSDLKESGCINEIFDINIKNKPRNALYIKNIIRCLEKFQFFNIFFINSELLSKNNIINTNIRSEYTFKILYQNSYFILTNNHKCLINYKWLIVNNFSNSTIITLLRDLNKLSNRPIFQYSLISKIYYYNHNIVYDLSMMSSMHFICQNIILHNSIEQDADIVMMLYEKANNDYNTINNEKVIDIIISKNRNGPIGSCQLIFSKNNTSFKNIPKNKTTYMDL